MNEDLMLLKIIHSRKFARTLENFKMNFITKAFNYVIKVVSWYNPCMLLSLYYC